MTGKLQEWDHTNFLVDLAGHYANCDQLRRTGTIRVDRRTPEGQTITGFVDNMDGSGTDINAVNGYLRSLVDRWTRARTYDDMVSRLNFDTTMIRDTTNTQRMMKGGNSVLYAMLAYR